MRFAGFKNLKPELEGCTNFCRAMGDVETRRQKRISEMLPKGSTWG
jgi:hypothetical protein